MSSPFAIVFFAFAIERFVQYVVKPLWPDGTAYAGYLALVLGIGVAFGFQLDAFSALGIATPWPWVAELATGFVIGGGSHLTNDLFSLIRGSDAGGVGTPSRRVTTTD